MKNVFIRIDDRKYITLWEEILILGRRILIKVSIEKLSIKRLDDTVIVLVPKYKHYNIWTKNRIAKQINKILEKNKFENCLYSENVKFFHKYIENKNIKTEKILMKNLILGILEYICNINKINTELENIHIFVNQYSKNNIKIIENLCKKFKTVNIITENFKYFKRLENSLYNEGILITLSNNKRKSAKNAKIIVNMDFEKEKIEQYNVNMNSIFINLTNEKLLFEKFFRGIMINNIELILNEDFIYYINEVFGDVDIKMFLEILLRDKDCEDVKNILKKYDGKIASLVGVRGIIPDCEFYMKTLDKQLKLI